MIDKKSFRVTNKQAKQLKDCDNMNCSGCRAFNDGCAHLGRSVMAADLLDSRELIDKQETLIKEMRAFIYSIEFGRLSDEVKADDLLEKTKEYV